MKTVFIQRSVNVAAAQWELIKRIRAEREQAPIKTDSGAFQFDEKSRARMLSVVEACGSMWVGWYDINNDCVDFSPTEFTQLYYELVRQAGLRVLALGEFTAALRAQLPLPAGHPALRGEGWPL